MAGPFENASINALHAEAISVWIVADSTHQRGFDSAQRLIDFGQQKGDLPKKVPFL
jgi:hypothetical protein